jgi:hypothetical protein
MAPAALHGYGAEAFGASADQPLVDTHGAQLYDVLRGRTIVVDLDTYSLPVRSRACVTTSSPT